jgi:hypothetical protein
MTFPISMRSLGPSEVERPILVETCDEGLLSNSYYKFDLQKAYNRLFKKCSKLRKMNDS